MWDDVWKLTHIFRILYGFKRPARWIIPRSFQNVVFGFAKGNFQLKHFKRARPMSFFMLNKNRGLVMLVGLVESWNCEILEVKSPTFEQGRSCANWPITRWQKPNMSFSDHFLQPFPVWKRCLVLEHMRPLLFWRDFWNFASISTPPPGTCFGSTRSCRSSAAADDQFDPLESDTEEQRGFAKRPCCMGRSMGSWKRLLGAQSSWRSFTVWARMAEPETS